MNNLPLLLKNSADSQHQLYWFEWLGHKVCRSLFHRFQNKVVVFHRRNQNDRCVLLQILPQEVHELRTRYLRNVNVRNDQIRFFLLDQLLSLFAVFRQRKLITLLLQTEFERSEQDLFVFANENFLQGAYF